MSPLPLVGVTVKEPPEQMEGGALSAITGVGLTVILNSFTSLAQPLFEATTLYSNESGALVVLMMVAASIFGPVALVMYPLSPVTGATIQEKVVPGSMVELNTISFVRPPEQMVCVRLVLVMTGSSLNSNLEKVEVVLLVRHWVLMVTFIL